MESARSDLRTFAISRRSPLARRQDLAQVLVDVARPTGLLVYLQSSYAPPSPAANGFCLPATTTTHATRRESNPKRATWPRGRARADGSRVASTEAVGASFADRRPVHHRADGEAARRARFVPAPQRVVRRGLAIHRDTPARGRVEGFEDSPSSDAPPTIGRTAKPPGARDLYPSSGGSCVGLRPRVALAPSSVSPAGAH